MQKAGFLVTHLNSKQADNKIISAKLKEKNQLKLYNV